MASKRGTNILSTPRLLLRQWTPHDAIHLYLLNLDPEVIRHTPDKPFGNVEEAREFIAGYTQYSQFGVGRWAVIHRETGDFLGWCGIKYHPQIREYDLGYRFFRKYWGQGYATESSAACIVYAFEQLGLESLLGRVWDGNEASVRVLEKCNMLFEKKDMIDGRSGVIYRITNPKIK